MSIDFALFESRSGGNISAWFRNWCPTPPLRACLDSDSTPEHEDECDDAGMVG